MQGDLIQRKIISLCDVTGIWSKPYADAGYVVLRYDIQRDPREDIRLITAEEIAGVHGVIAQPPCTHLAGSGARWWQGKGQEVLTDALALVDACLRVVTVGRPAWWVLENPVGRLSRYLGDPEMTYQPHEYAGWSSDPAAEAYTKRTCLWGRFNHPRRREVEPVLGSKMHRLPPGPQRANLRSKTPEGFARAFFEANP